MLRVDGSICWCQQVTLVCRHDRDPLYKLPWGGQAGASFRTKHSLLACVCMYLDVHHDKNEH